MNDNGPKQVKKRNLIIMLVVATILSIILVQILNLNKSLLIELLFLSPELISPPLNFLGIVLIVLGFIFVIWANFTLLYIGKIGLNDREPFHVPYKLVIDGPYRYSRNPIYMGVVLLTIGFGLIISSVTILFLSLVLLLVFRYSLIRWEERNLEEKFGEEYILYKKRVRRWI